MNKEKDKSYIGSLAKGMDVLSLVVHSKTVLGITEISRVLNLSIGSVQRVTNTLQKLGYLRKDENKQGYVLGYKAWGLGLSIIKDIDLKRVAHPYLQELSQEIGETVNLAILDGWDIVYVDRIKTEQIININLSIGSRLPVYCTSMGKSLLAFLPDNEISKILDAIDIKPITPNTITDKSRLLEELQQVRQRGFSLNDRELEIGLRSVAAPVRDESKRVIAAVNIAVPSTRITLEELSTDLANKAVNVARIISEGMGYTENQ
ncbi:MAG: IclR family transcriptional regulator [Deltaproteobacteria bacterium]|nr:IclR family transcriptional regulator [Deltaproteobacteria bacterium]